MIHLLSSEKSYIINALKIWQNILETGSPDFSADDLVRIETYRLTKQQIVTLKPRKQLKDRQLVKKLQQLIDKVQK